MKFFQKRAVAAVVLILAIVAGVVIGQAKKPDTGGQASTAIVGSYTYVYDYAGVLTDETMEHIDAMNASLFAQTGAQILVSVVNSTGGADIMDYASDLGNSYGVGSAERNNGVVMLLALDVRFAFVWGLLAFALNYIPNIGSVLAAIPPILQVLVFSGLYDALVLLAGYLAINLLFGNILEPRMMGRGLGLSTLVVFLSLIFWGWLLGPVGMLLSVPLTIIVKIGLEQTEGGQSIAVLLSDMSQK